MDQLDTEEIKQLLLSDDVVKSIYNYKKAAVKQSDITWFLFMSFAATVFVGFYLTQKPECNTDAISIECNRRIDSMQNFVDTSLFVKGYQYE